VPDCVILFTRLVRDQRVPRRHKLLLGERKQLARLLRELGLDDS
jgi:hypothetical protein